jgi:hypothetical protein
METIPVELWQEILLRASTKDVARSCCVSTQWRDIVRDPSFRKLHHDRHATAHDVPDALLVATYNIDSQRVASVFPVEPAAVSPTSSTRTATAPICRVNHMEGYRIANICNGFLCFASHSTAKAIVHNPVTGERLEVPRAPRLPPDQDNARSPVTFALGFSPNNCVYKLFRFTNRTMDVYTLGRGAESTGWRRHALPLHPRNLVESKPAVVIGGKICMATIGPAPYRHPADNGTPGPVLVVDVAHEEPCTYSPPDYGLPWADAAVSVFELHGRLCLAIRTERMIQFWTMPVEEDDDDQPWQLLYKFKVVDDEIIRFNQFQRLVPMSAWLDGHTNTLCYREGNNVYHKYVGTTTATVRRFSSTKVVIMSWDSKICLPVASSSLSSFQWDIYAGYRPTLLSPLTFASGQHEEDDNKCDLFIRSLLRTLRSQKSQKCRPSPTSAGCTNAKRICCINPRGF